MGTFLTLGIASASFLSVVLLFIAARDLGATLSPQGCRMSWMSPSYVLQSSFNTSWTPLANRYSLWLYREAGWDPAKIGDSLPVIFIPGNAGSSHQVRSIASSATRQYFSSPHQISQDFAGRSNVYKPLDFYAVEFNEDLSAFHGTTLESQIDYTSKAIAYILSLYPPNTRITVLGHSMGGIVATSLPLSPNVSAVITMSTPFTLPPARFDSNIDEIYSRVERVLAIDSTPIVSLCGGATDMMIPSESCILPRTSQGPFRRTVFSSALEGAWTGVGHREMVWCHQVRWRVARAALELAPHAAMEQRTGVLDRWLRDGSTLPSHMGELRPLNPSNIGHESVLPLGQRLVVDALRDVQTHFLPVPTLFLGQGQRRFTLLASRGAVHSVGPEVPLPFQVSVYEFGGPDLQHSTATPLQPAILKLLPAPIPNKPFPIPQEGSDESEGIVLLEAFVENFAKNTTHIAVKIEGGDGRGWVIADFGDDEATSSSSTLSLLFGRSIVPMPSQQSLHNVLKFPNVLSHALLVYRVTALGKGVPRCKDSRFPPLLAHTSNQDETHYFGLVDQSERRVVLHTHMPAPFIFTPQVAKGLILDIYSSGMSDCADGVNSLAVSIDWPATLGRWATRYGTSAVVWALGVVAVVIFHSWEADGGIPPVSASLHRYGSLLVRRLLLASFLFSFVPLPESYYLGNAGKPIFAFIAPLVLMISSGLVVMVWWILCSLLYMGSKINGIVSRSNARRADISSVTKNTLISIGILLLAIFLFVPWQVAFLGCWVLQLYTCAVPRPVASDESYTADERTSRTAAEKREETSSKNAKLNHHILLLMTLLLPLVAPILAVWVRTLATAGLTTPFNGDHNFVMVAPFLVLVDFASWTQNEIFIKAKFENTIPVRWLFAVIAGIAFTVGSRKPYLVFHATTITFGIIVCTKIGRRYWGGSPSKSVNA